MDCETHRPLRDICAAKGFYLSTMIETQENGFCIPNYSMRTLPCPFQSPSCVPTVYKLPTQSAFNYIINYVLSRTVNRPEVMQELNLWHMGVIGVNHLATTHPGSLPCSDTSSLVYIHGYIQSPSVLLLVSQGTCMEEGRIPHTGTTTNRSPG